MYYVNSTSKITFVLIFRSVYMGWFQYPSKYSLGYCSITSCFLNFAFDVVCDMQDLYTLIPCQKFRRLFSRLGQTHSFIWGPYAAEHGMVLI
jgi:hypothetical protein